MRYIYTTRYKPLKNLLIVTYNQCNQINEKVSATLSLICWKMQHSLTRTPSNPPRYREAIMARKFKYFVKH